jgi:hypothetical protein
MLIQLRLRGDNDKVSVRIRWEQRMEKMLIHRMADEGEVITNATEKLGLDGSRRYGLKRNGGGNYTEGELLMLMTSDQSPQERCMSGQPLPRVRVRWGGEMREITLPKHQMGDTEAGQHIVRAFPELANRGGHGTGAGQRTRKKGKNQERQEPILAEAGGNKGDHGTGVGQRTGNR